MHTVVVYSRMSLRVCIVSGVTDCEPARPGKREIQRNSYIGAPFKPCISSGRKTATTRLDVLPSTFFGRHSSQAVTPVTPAKMFAHVFFKVGTTPTLWT